MKTAAAWAIAFIAKHNEDLAQKVVDIDGVDYLVACVQEPEIKLKRIAAGCLSEICKHNESLARKVVEA